MYNEEIQNFIAYAMKVHWEEVLIEFTVTANLAQ